MKKVMKMAHQMTREIKEKYPEVDYRTQLGLFISYLLEEGKNKEVKKVKKDFNSFRFAGLNHREKSNKYWTMDRVSEDGNKIVVKVADSHLITTKFGYALILDNSHVVFLKEWQVSQNWFGNEVVLDKNYWNVKEWGNHEEFGEDEENLKWETWLTTAKEQQAAGTVVNFAK